MQLNVFYQSFKIFSVYHRESKLSHTPIATVQLDLIGCEHALNAKSRKVNSTPDLSDPPILLLNGLGEFLTN
jgi:hypothetical protein